MTPASDTNLEARRNYAGPSVARLSSSLPDDARAVIEREPRSVTQSAPAGRRGWRLRFYPCMPRGADPLTGWTTGADPLAPLSLRFPDLASAIRYAERHDLPYEVREESRGNASFSRRQKYEGQAPVQLCCWPTGPHALCCGKYPWSSRDVDVHASATEARAGCEMEAAERCYPCSN